MSMLQSIAQAINFKTEGKAAHALQISFHLFIRPDRLTFGYLWCSPSTAHATYDNSEKQNAIRLYSQLFAWNYGLY